MLGYTCGNDVSARDWQIKMGGSQWCRGKTFDTFCPLGPCLVTTDEIPNPNALAIQARCSTAKSMQDWNTDDMIFDVPTLIEFLSGSTTLLPGTVILTGTPHGVGMARKPPVWLKAGDQRHGRDREDRHARRTRSSTSPSDRCRRTGVRTACEIRTADLSKYPL